MSDRDDPASSGASPAPPTLAHLPSAELERLRTELQRWPSTNLTRPALAAARLGHLWPPLHALGVLEPRALSALITTVLAERTARPPTRVDLVWTGGEGKLAYARSTASVVRELFEAAERHVLIAGYSFDHGASLLEPLHRTMLERGVSTDLYLHIDRAPQEVDLDDYVERAVASFFAVNWPFGTPHPAIHIAPSTIEPDSFASLHAKCVVMDERIAIVGSANFTERGQERNVEVGARIDDAGFARALVGQFRVATNAGVFIRMVA